MPYFANGTVFSLLVGLDPCVFMHILLGEMSAFYDQLIVGGIFRKEQHIFRHIAHVILLMLLLTCLNWALKSPITINISPFPAVDTARERLSYNSFLTPVSAKNVVAGIRAIHI